MTRRVSIVIAGGLGIMLVGVGAARSASCLPDAVQVGPTCVDRYEASSWAVPQPPPKGLVKRIAQGKATRADLEGAGAVRLGVYGSTAVPAPGALVYALSIAGVPPSLASWYGAQQACARSGKRLLTNEEWERAAAGTPDPGPGGASGPEGCNHHFDWPPYDAGSRSECVSSWGAYDMVGNFGEWVADWVFPQPADFDPTVAPAIHPIIDGIAGLHRPEPRYFAEDVSDGIGYRCAR